VLSYWLVGVPCEVQNFFIAMNLFDWIITKKYETLETPKIEVFNLVIEMHKSTTIFHNHKKNMVPPMNLPWDFVFLINYWPQV